jgi:hypothetical protein
MSAVNQLRQYAFVPEVTFGVTPGTPQTQLIEVVSFDGNLEPSQLSDNSIRPDRQVAFSRRGNNAAQGSMVVKMCPDNYDVLLEAALMGTWTGNTLKIGSTKRSFAFEEGFTDIDQYQVFNGVTFNTFEIKVDTENLVEASFGFMASGVTALTGTSIDSTPTAIVTKDKFSHEGGTVSEDGSPLAHITAVSLTLNNNYTGNYAIGNTSYRSVSPGKASVSGSLTALFESPAFYNKFLNSTDSVISFTLAAGSPAETLTFKVSKVKYTSGTLQRGETGPVFVELGYEGVFDTTDATTLMITRSA